MTDEAGKSHSRPDEAALDAALDALRAARPAPSDALMARILADADRLQPVATAAPRAGRPARWRIDPGAWIARAFGPLGGWPAATTLAASALLGVWVGYSGSVPVDLVTGTAADVDAAGDVAADADPFDAFFLEG